MSHGLTHQTHDDHHSHSLNLFTHSEMGVIFASTALRSIGLSFIGIFVPIMMYEAGYSFKAIVLILLPYFLLVHIFVIIGTILIQRISVKKMMFIGSIIDASQFILFPLLINTKYLFLLPIMAAIGRGLFFSGFNADFGRAVKGRKSGAKLGWLNLIAIFGSTSGPLLGSLLIVLFSYDVTFYFGGFLYVASSLVLMLRKDFKPKAKVDFNRAINIAPKKCILGFIPFGFLYAVMGFVWPLYVFVILENKVVVGILSTSVALAVATISIFVGKYSDIHQRVHNKIVRKASVITAITYVARALVIHPISLFIFSTMSAMAHLFVVHPVQSDFFKRVNGKGSLNYVIFREIGWLAGRAIGGIIMVIVVHSFESITILNYTITNLQLVIILAAMSTLLFPMTYHNRKYC